VTWQNSRSWKETHYFCKFCLPYDIVINMN
jgi:hypothetical protein